MWLRTQFLPLMGVLIVLCVVPACREATEAPGPSPSATTYSNGAPSKDDGAPQPGATQPGATRESTPIAEEEPTPPPTVPTVLLDARNEATCLVKVGDVFPDGTLFDKAGTPVDTKSLLGKNLVVVYFWTAKNPYAVAGLEDIGTLVPNELTEMGAVRIIAVNEGDTPETAAALIDNTDSHVMNLFDPKGAFFAKVATEQLPRIYLIDSAGKVVWFDIEYSSSTKRNLRQALEVALSTKPASQ